MLEQLGAGHLMIKDCCLLYNRVWFILNLNRWKPPTGSLSSSTYSVYKSSTIATMMTMSETEKIWQPEPMSEENISGWLDGRNTSPCTCFHPYSSPRSLSCSNTQRIKIRCHFRPPVHGSLQFKSKKSFKANVQWENSYHVIHFLLFTVSGVILSQCSH